MKICEDDDDGDGTGDDVALDDEWDLWKVLLLESFHHCNDTSFGCSVPL